VKHSWKKKLEEKNSNALFTRNNFKLFFLNLTKTTKHNSPEENTIDFIGMWNRAFLVNVNDRLLLIDYRISFFSHNSLAHLCVLHCTAYTLNLFFLVFCYVINSIRKFTFCTVTHDVTVMSVINFFSGIDLI
jgi:hypothetical protein